MCRVHLDAWIRLQLKQQNLLLDGKELVEVQHVFASQFPTAELLLGRVLKGLTILVAADESVVRVVGVEDLTNHEHLVLAEPLVEVVLHWEVIVSGIC